jgi:hypothetical protein
MRTDKFTRMLDDVYAGYVRAARKYGFEPLGKRAFLARMRRLEW